jgi:hypothetical protein
MRRMKRRKRSRMTVKTEEERKKSVLWSLGYDPVWSGKYLPMFWRNLQPHLQGTRIGLSHT